MADRSPDLLDAGDSRRLLESLEAEQKEDRRLLKWAVMVAILMHAPLLLVTLPKIVGTAKESSRSRNVFVVRQVRFEPPPPKPQAARRVQEPRKKRIPIPDPTPRDPEPIYLPEVELPEIEAPEIDIGAMLGIPEGPSTEGETTGERGPLHLGDDIEPPIGIFMPRPRYTEEARRARIRGVVLLKSVIDEGGNVTRLEVLKGLPFGLTESALETVRTWKYEPATLDGEPVPVYFHLMVSFSVQ